MYNDVWVIKLPVWNTIYIYLVSLSERFCSNGIDSSLSRDTRYQPSMTSCSVAVETSPAYGQRGLYEHILKDTF